MLSIFRYEPRYGRSPHFRSSVSSDDSDDDIPNVNSPNQNSSVADQDSLAKVNKEAFTTAAISGVKHDKEQEGGHRNSKDPNAEIDEPSREAIPQGDSDDIQIASLNDPHIFLLAVAVRKPETPRKRRKEEDKAAYIGKGYQSSNLEQPFYYNTTRLQKMFRDMHESLRSKKFERYFSYKKCPSHTLQEAETRSLQISREDKNAFEQKAESDSRPKEVTSSTKSISEASDYLFNHPRRQKKFMKLAKTLFAFFLPLEFNSALVAKFWGAVYVLVEVKLFPSVSTNFVLICLDQDPRGLRRASITLEDDGEWPTGLLEDMAIFSHDWTQEKAPQPWKVKFPDILAHAWLHLVMALVLSVDNGSYSAIDREFQAIRRAVAKGRDEILRSLAPNSLYELEAVLPLGITSLIVKNLVGHGVPGQPDIASTYLEYLDRLVRETRFTYFRNESYWPIH